MQNIYFSSYYKFLWFLKFQKFKNTALNETLSLNEVRKKCNYKTKHSCFVLEWFLLWMTKIMLFKSVMVLVCKCLKYLVTEGGGIKIGEQDSEDIFM